MDATTVTAIRQYFQNNRHVHVFLTWVNGVLYEVERDKSDLSVFTARPPGWWKWRKDAPIVDTR